MIAFRQGKTDNAGLLQYANRTCTVFWEGPAPLVTNALFTMSLMNYYLWTQKLIDKYTDIRGGQRSTRPWGSVSVEKRNITAVKNAHIHTEVFSCMRNISKSDCLRKQRYSLNPFYTVDYLFRGFMVRSLRKSYFSLKKLQLTLS